MKEKIKHPLMAKTHLPLIILGSVMVVYGLATIIIGSWLSNQAMNGDISAAVYRARLDTFEKTLGLIAGFGFLVLFILSAVKSNGRVRTSFIIGSFACISPILTGRIGTLLFKVIGIPTMGAGSVIAGAVTTLFFFLPMTIFYIFLAADRKLPNGCRWISLVSILIVLVTSFYLIYVTVLAFLFKPGDPDVGRMIQTSTQVIRMRFLLPGITLLLLSWISLRFAKKQSLNVSHDQSVAEGE